MDPDLQPWGEGTRLRLRVRPGGGRDAVLGVRDGTLRLSVAAPPEKGKANRAVRRLLASVLQVRLSEVELTSGESSRDKTVRIALSPAEVRARLRKLERHD